MSFLAQTGDGDGPLPRLAEVHDDVEPHPEPGTPEAEAAWQAEKDDPATPGLPRPVRPRRRGLLGFAIDVVDESDRDRVLGLAAETAFFVVLGLFPTLLLVVAVLGYLDALVGQDLAAQVEEETVERVRQLLSDQASTAVESLQELFSGGRSLLTLAAVLSTVSVSTAFATVVNSLNRAYDAPESRSWLRRRVLGLLLGLATVVVGALLVVLVVAGPLLLPDSDTLQEAGLLDRDGLAWSVLRPVLVFVGLVLFAAALYHLSPAVRTTFLWDLPGALGAASAWFAVTYGIYLYVRLASGANPVLGALGGGLIIMTWIYLLVLVLLIGGEINAELRRRRATPGRRSRRGSGDTVDA